MFNRVRRRFRALVREREYILTIYALEEMGEDDVLAEDVEHAILTGKIVERQVDRATKERKDVLAGMDLAGKPMGVVLKMGSTGKVVVVTVYRKEE